MNKNNNEKMEGTMTEIDLSILDAISPEGKRQIEETIRKCQSILDEANRTEDILFVELIKRCFKNYKYDEIRFEDPMLYLEAFFTNLFSVILTESDAAHVERLIQTIYDAYKVASNYSEEDRKNSIIKAFDYADTLKLKYKEHTVINSSVDESEKEDESKKETVKIKVNTSSNKKSSNEKPSTEIKRMVCPPIPKNCSAYYNGEEYYEEETNSSHIDSSNNTFIPDKNKSLDEQIEDFKSYLEKKGITEEKLDNAFADLDPNKTDKFEKILQEQISKAFASFIEENDKLKELGLNENDLNTLINLIATNTTKMAELKQA